MATKLIHKPYMKCKHSMTDIVIAPEGVKEFCLICSTLLNNHSKKELVNKQLFNHFRKLNRKKNADKLNILCSYGYAKNKTEAHYKLLYMQTYYQQLKHKYNGPT